MPDVVQAEYERDRPAREERIRAEDRRCCAEVTWPWAYEYAVPATTHTYPALAPPPLSPPSLRHPALHHMCNPLSLTPYPVHFTQYPSPLTPYPSCHADSGRVG